MTTMPMCIYYLIHTWPDEPHDVAVKWLMRLIIATKNDALAYFSNTQYKTNQTILQPTTNFEFQGR